MFFKWTHSLYLWKPGYADRVNNHLGYIKGNVRVICSGCNLLKSTFDAYQAMNIARMFSSIKTADQAMELANKFTAISRYITEHNSQPSDPPSSGPHLS